MRDFHDTPIPPIMQHLPRDARGYPIPDNVFRGNDGRAHFAINDTNKRHVHLRENRCPICGKRMNVGYWFAGGPRSAFDEHGAYNDLPMHHQCMQYAMQVCPYLAMPNYQKRMDDKTLKPKDRRHGMFFIDPSVIPPRPVVFVCVFSKRRQILPSGLIRPVRPYSKIEYWKDGEQLSAAEGERIVESVLQAPFPRMRSFLRLVG